MPVSWYETPNIRFWGESDKKVASTIQHNILLFSFDDFSRRRTIPFLLRSGFPCCILSEPVVARPVRAIAAAGPGLLPRVHPPLLLLLQVQHWLRTLHFRWRCLRFKLLYTYTPLYLVIINTLNIFKGTLA
jgi:hypothetical protein